MIRGVAPLTAIGLMIVGGGSVLLLGLTVAEILQDDDVSTPKIEWTPKLSTSAERLTSVTPLNAYQHFSRPANHLSLRHRLFHHRHPRHRRQVLRPLSIQASRWEAS